ncbi:vWA domain-containing protein, partial [Deferrisoma sp.]
GILFLPGEMRRGDYRGTPIERLLPVKLGPGEEDTSGDLALVAVVDTSFSMFYPLGPRRVRKIDMAKEALLRLARSVGDAGGRFGVLGVEAHPYWVVGLHEDLPAGRIEERVARLVAIGAGIQFYSGLLEAGRALRRTEAARKHVLVLADTADVDEYEVTGAGTVWDLVGGLRAEGITVSLVGFGTPGDAHVPLLNRLVSLSGGYLYLATDATEVPGFALRDLDAIAADPIRRLRVGVRPERYPEIEGLLASRPVPGARVPVRSLDGTPVAGVWRVGRGGVGVFLADPGAGGWAGGWAGWVWEELLSGVPAGKGPAAPSRGARGVGPVAAGGGEGKTERRAGAPLVGWAVAAAAAAAGGTLLSQDT